MARPNKEIMNMINNKDIVWIEIGVNLGYTAEKAFKEKDIGKMILIDPYIVMDHEMFKSKSLRNSQRLSARERLCDYSERCVWIEKTSSSAAAMIEDSSVDVIFVDGNHEFEYVKSDIELYIRKLKDGGLMILDDYGHQDYPGVRKALDRFLQESGQDKYIVNEFLKYNQATIKKVYDETQSIQNS